MTPSDSVIQLADDIYQVRLPLPFALRIVNCYLLRGDDGWTVLDTGLNVPAGQGVWLATFARLGISPGDIRQIVLTHSHPDHFGLAGWLQSLVASETSAPAPPVYMSVREAELARMTWMQPNGFGQQVLEFWYTCGVPEHLAEPLLLQTLKTRALTRPHPPVIESLQPGSVLQIGRRSLQVIHAPGHSDAQLIFYDPDDRLLLCGDQVLIKITPNVSLWPAGEPDPLRRYLASLRELAGLDVRVALPGHGPLITHWRARLGELQRHHTARLEHTITAARTRSTPYEISTQLFEHEELSHHEIRFAVAETLAHLEFLRIDGQVERVEERQQADGVLWRYRLVG